MKSLILFSLMIFSQGNVAEAAQTDVIIEEFDRLKSFVKTLEPDYIVGGLANAKVVGDHEIIWNLAENESDYDFIHIYAEGKDSAKDFSVVYYRGTHIVENTNVVRRFVGPSLSGWRNDTVEYETGYYFGRQGAQFPILSDRDKEILSKWNITLIAE